MTSRYRVDYALKEHRRDELIEWIKGLLATPFVLYAVKPAGTISEVEEVMISSEAKRRYAEIFSDLEKLVSNHIEMTNAGIPEMGRLKQLVPSVGTFFTPLPLEKAFYIEDERRGISKRRLVAPSFNDVRIILNTAQVLMLASTFQNGHRDKKGSQIRMNDDYLKMTTEPLKLITFDGDITLYPDGSNLEPESSLVGQMIELLRKGLCVGIVTAAGYGNAEKYYERLHGLVQALNECDTLTDIQKQNMIIVGGEANYLFRYNCEKQGLVHLHRDEWLLADMKLWDPQDIADSLEYAGRKFDTFISKLGLKAEVIHKEHSVGLVPLEGHALIREQLEEVVLRLDKDMKRFKASQNIEWCAFNGGADVWFDIGDKAYGVRILQEYLTRTNMTHFVAENTLHIGDQFSSLGANDYASRTAACTAWVSSPKETSNLLRDLITYMDDWATY